MKDGFYGIDFVQERNFGFAVLVFDNGRITGVDVGGACIDGSYRQAAAGQPVDLSLEVSIPPDVPSIFGVKRDHLWSFPIETCIEPAESGELVLRMPVGSCLTARYRYLRGLAAAT